MNKAIKIAALLCGGWFAAHTVLAQQTHGYYYISDKILLDGKYWAGQYAYAIPKLGNPKPLQTRDASAKEQEVIAEAKHLFENSSLKAIALIDGDNILWKAYKAPAGDESIFTGFSLGKTITSMMVGKSICAGKISMTTTADALLPELKGTGYESVTVADMLTMRSGIQDGRYWNSGVPEALQKIKQIQTRQAKWRDILGIVNKRHSNLFTGITKPGEKFEYKETDPLALGLMLQEAWGERLTPVIEREVLTPAGMEGPAELQESGFMEPYAPTIGRFRLDDWIRFAIWMKNSTREQGCFGDYMRAATTMQTKTVAGELGAGLFDGYGYLTWIASRGLPASYWGMGFGGQKLAMNHKNDRILVVFSSVENNGLLVSDLYRKWATLD